LLRNMTTGPGLGKRIRDFLRPPTRKLGGADRDGAAGQRTRPEGGAKTGGRPGANSRAPT